MTILLGLLLNLPETVDAHTSYTLNECAQHAHLVEGAANAKEAGKPVDWTIQKIMDYILLRQKDKRPFFVKDDQDMEYVLGSVNLVYHREGTPKEFHDRAYEACLNVLLDKKEGGSYGTRFN